MRDFIRKIFKKITRSDSRAENASGDEINRTTNAVFEKYEKCFKDLARYDREGKIPAN